MYRKLFTLALVIIVSISSFIYADSAEAMLVRGNEFYQANNYTKAIESYENLVEQGYEGTELFYNLGNAYYRIGKLGYAILYYEKAKKLSPSDEDVQHNLALANLQTVDKIETLPPFFLFQWWESLLAFFSISGWAIFGYILFLLLLGLILLYTFTRQPAVQRYSVYGTLSTLVLFILCIAVITVSVNRESKVKSAIIVEQTATAKLSPDNKSNDAFVIHEGLKVNVEDQVASWLKVRLDDGKIGWLPKENVRII